MEHCWNNKYGLAVVSAWLPVIVMHTLCDHVYYAMCVNLLAFVFFASKSEKEGEWGKLGGPGRCKCKRVNCTGKYKCGVWQLLQLCFSLVSSMFSVLFSPPTPSPNNLSCLNEPLRCVDCFKIVCIGLNESCAVVCLACWMTDIKTQLQTGHTSDLYVSCWRVCVCWGFFWGEEGGQKDVICSRPSTL